MATATERIPVLVTPMEKGRIAKMAKAAGVSMGEFLRRAATSYRSSEDDEVLLGMIDQMNKTTARTSAAIDDALTFVETSNKRIAAMERKAA
jgi:Ribbon-helix-helix protein, copG family